MKQLTRSFVGWIYNGPDGHLLPRLVADYLLVNIAALVILAAPVAVAIVSGMHGRAVTLMTLGLDYYTRAFLPLSCLFPVAFLLNGSYRHHSPWSGPRKLLASARGAIVGVLIFALVDRMIARKDSNWSPDFVQLSLAIVIAVATARLFKDALLKRFSIQRRGAAKHRTVLVVGGAGYIGSILVPSYSPVDTTCECSTG